MKTALIILNLSAAILVFPAMKLVQKAQTQSAIHMYVELDRAQIIDKPQLQRMFPRQAANDRYEIPNYFVGKRNIAWIIGYPCAAGFLLNAFLIAIFCSGKTLGGGNK